jgi:hypothetical protein
MTKELHYDDDLIYRMIVSAITKIDANIDQSVRKRLGLEMLKYEPKVLKLSFY